MVMARAFTYDSTDIVEQYDKARELPAETYQLWANAITKDLPCESIYVVCDVGCGTGRFSVLLADNFSAQVVGIDPSKKMLVEAKCKISNSSITYVAGIAEALPLENSGVDALFLSMSYHHIQDMSQAISEFKRVLCRPGYIIIRTSTRQSLLTYPWLRFFPTAYKIERNRTPDRYQLTDFFLSNEFGLFRCDTISQLFAVDYMQYFLKLSSRGLSSLKAISDAEFDDGCNRLEEFCKSKPIGEQVFEEIDLYVFMW
jgi:ubiquinone/menaquinone biosynthesis C-methylase UbiE